jgi:hypothetical protein
MDEQTRQIARLLVIDRARQMKLELTHGAVEMLAMPISEDPELQGRLAHLGNDQITNEPLAEVGGGATISSLDVLLKDIKDNLHSGDEGRASASSIVASFHRNFCRIPPFCRRGT